MATDTGRITVRKYGGSSVATADKIREIATMVADAVRGGESLVLVVSAMGDTTDDLLLLAARSSGKPAPRELDSLLATGETVSAALMAMALRECGIEAVSLSGAQAGILAGAHHGNGEILEVNPVRILEEIRDGRTPVIAGFQGITERGDTITLGRGGSDTTAVAIAVALHADRCEIYTDVPGVLTTDPRIDANARVLDSVGYGEMLELSSTGAKVLHPRAVELGERERMPIFVGSTFGKGTGTVIEDAAASGARKVRGIAYEENVAKITLCKVPDKPGVAATVFGALAEARINVDIIVQNVSHDLTTDISFTVLETDLERAHAVLHGVLDGIGAEELRTTEQIAKVSVVGSGIRGTPGVFATAFSALADQGINIEMISTSETYLACIVGRGQGEDAVRALHEAYRLGEEDG